MTQYLISYMETLRSEKLNKIELSYFKNILSYAKKHPIFIAKK
jgi:hypothetical protein